MEAALDGVALAEVLQDGPHILQVAGCGQPHRDGHALRGGGGATMGGSRDQAWPLTEGVETEDGGSERGGLVSAHRRPPPAPRTLAHPTPSLTLAGLLSWGLEGGGREEGGVTPCRPVRPLPPALSRQEPEVRATAQELGVRPRRGPEL